MGRHFILFYLFLNSINGDYQEDLLLSAHFHVCSQCLFGVVQPIGCEFYGGRYFYLFSFPV